MYDYVIIGAGPAGIQLGYFFEKQNRNYIILEASNECGSFFNRFPRHQKLLSINKVYTGYSDKEINLRWDWNSLICDEDNLLLKNYTEEYFPKASSLVKYLNDFSKRYALKINYKVKIIKITKENDYFYILDNCGNEYFCKRLIVATGVSKPYIPSISGIELADYYHNSDLNPQKYKNKKVLIIGKGNSAFETAESLNGFSSHIHLVSPNKTIMAWKSHFPGHLRAINNNLIDTFQLKSQNAILNDQIKKIERRGNQFYVWIVYTDNGNEDINIYDHIIVCTGFKFDNSIFTPSCSPELTLNDRFPSQTSEWESKNIKDLYFIGTLMQARDYKKTASPFIHGFRYNINILSKILAFKYHNEPLDSISIPLDINALTAAILDRINTTSSLWQQFGFIGDLIIINKEKNEIYYYPDLPVDYIHENNFGQHENYYIVTLNYTTLAKNLPSSESQLSIVSPNQKEKQFLHPIVRHFCKNQLISEHHIAEDLTPEWWDIDLYIKPLQEFLKSTIGIDIKEERELSSFSKNTNCKMLGNKNFMWPTIREVSNPGKKDKNNTNSSTMTNLYSMFCNRKGILAISAMATAISIGFSYYNKASNQKPTLG